MKRARRCAFALALCATSASQAGPHTIYHCVDAEGHKRISDQPCAPPPSRDAASVQEEVRQKSEQEWTSTQHRIYGSGAIAAEPAGTQHAQPVATTQSEPESQQARDIRKSVLTRGIARGAGLKPFVAEYYQAHGEFPSSNEQVGIKPPESYADEWGVAALAIASKGVINVRLGTWKTFAGGFVQLRPKASDIDIQWECVSPGITDIGELIPVCKYAP